MLRKRIAAFGAVAFLIWFGSVAQSQPNNPPALSVRAFDNQSVRLAWPKAATNFMLEMTEQLGSPSIWQPVTNIPAPSGEELTVTLAAGGVARFFRLQRGGGPDDDDDDDGLSNADEIARGTNPSLADTDGDGWSDGVEVADGTDPLDPNSMPRMYFVGQPPIEIALHGMDEIVQPAAGVTIARPPIQAIFADLNELGGFGAGTTRADPPILIALPNTGDAGLEGKETYFALPPIQIQFPDTDESGNPGLGTIFALPPIQIQFVP